VVAGNEDPVLVSLLIREFCSWDASPHDREGVSPRNTAARRGILLRTAAGQLVAQHRHAPPLGHAIVMKRPPGSAMMLRMRPYAGTMPVTAGVAALTRADARAPRDELGTDVLDLRPRRR